MVPPGPRFLYLHGFASSPNSAKALAMAEHLAQRGVVLDRLDLRLPTQEGLRLSAIVGATLGAIGGPSDRAVLIGSSLGGLAAARAAEADARVCALVLLAPAFQLATRWRERLGPARWAAWEQSGWLEIDDYRTRQKGRLDFGFVADAEAIEARNGGWPDVRVPTLVLHGRRDSTVDIAASRQWAIGKSHVRLVELDDGHELVDTLPEILAETDRALGSFWAL